MSVRFVFQNSLWIICMVLPVLGKSRAASSCEMTIGNCDYKLTLSPSNQCHGDAFIRSRSKRSEINDYQIGNIMDEFTSLQTDFEKLEKKLVKEMKSLSTRVLRGARRLETIADNVTSNGNGKKKRKCPLGFVTYDDWNNCYMFSTFNTSWYDARDYCVALGGDLVALRTLQEHFLVAFYILNNPEYSSFEGWWTSATYVTKTESWMWIWAGHVKPFTFVKWAVNEPNDEHEKSLQCLMMYKLDDLLWHDQICTDKYNFICEKRIA